MPRSPFLLRLLCALVLSAGLALVLASPREAGAHAFLRRTQPANGAVVAANVGEVRLVFTERVEARPDRVAVTDEGGRRVDLRNARLAPGDETTVTVGVPGLANGVYTVRYGLLSADSHPLNGRFRFGVGVSPADVLTGAPAEVDPTTPALGAPLLLDALGRWLNLLGLVLLIGPIAFRLFVLPRRTSSGRGDVTAVAARLVEGRLTRWVWLATLTLFLAGVVSLVAVSAGGSFGALGSALEPGALAAALMGRFGSLWMARLGLLLIPALALPLLAADRELREAREEGVEAGEDEAPTGAAAPVPARWDAAGWWAILGAGGGLALLTSFSGHAATTAPIPLSLLIGWTHTVATALWIGGLLSLALLLPPVLRSLGPADGNAILAGVAPRFSALALASVQALVLTGLYQTWAQVEGPAALATTAYGRTLLLKLALVVPLLVLGAVNRGVILPRLRRGATPSGALPDGDEGAERLRAARRALRRVVWGEAALGVVVIGIVGFLTALPPARGATATVAGEGGGTGAVSSPNEVTLAANAGPFVVTLTFGPTGNGPTVLSATVTQLSGGAAPAATVRLRLSGPSGATQEVALTPRNGRYVGLADLARDGRWAIEADVTVPGAATAAGTARFELALPTGGARLLLADADAAMNRLTALRERETIDSGQGVVTTEYEYAAPDQLRLRVDGGGETVAVGRRRFDRVAGGQWVAGAWLEEGGYRWPRFDWAAGATEVTLLRREEIDGEPSWVVAFFSPQEDARYTVWIGERDALVRRVRMVFTGHAMETRFYDFNAPITIEAPEGAR